MYLRIHLLYCFNQVVEHDLIGEVSSLSPAAITGSGMIVKTNDSPHIQLHWGGVHRWDICLKTLLYDRLHSKANSKRPLGQRRVACQFPGLHRHMLLLSQTIDPALVVDHATANRQASDVCWREEVWRGLLWCRESNTLTQVTWPFESFLLDFLWIAREGRAVVMGECMHHSRQTRWWEVGYEVPFLPASGISSSSSKGAMVSDHTYSHLFKYGQCPIRVITAETAVNHI